MFTEQTKEERKGLFLSCPGPLFTWPSVFPRWASVPPSVHKRGWIYPALMSAGSSTQGHRTDPWAPPVGEEKPNLALYSGKDLGRIPQPFWADGPSGG